MIYIPYIILGLRYNKSYENLESNSVVNYIWHSKAWSIDKTSGESEVVCGIVVLNYGGID